MPEAYRPPHLALDSSSGPDSEALFTRQEPMGSASVRSALTLPLLNPVPVLGYAMRIADQAVWLADQEGRSGHAGREAAGSATAGAVYTQAAGGGVGAT